MLIAVPIPDWANLGDQGFSRSSSLVSTNSAGQSTPPTTMLVGSTAMSGVDHQVLKDVIIPENAIAPAIQIIDETGRVCDAKPTYVKDLLSPIWKPSVQNSCTLAWKPSPVEETAQCHPVTIDSSLSPVLKAHEIKLRLELSMTPLTTWDEEFDEDLDFYWPDQAKSPDAMERSVSAPTSPVMSAHKIVVGQTTISAPPSPRCLVPYPVLRMCKGAVSPIKAQWPVKPGSKSVPSSPVLKTFPVAATISAPPSPHCVLPRVMRSAARSSTLLDKALAFFSLDGSKSAPAVEKTEAPSEAVPVRAAATFAIGDGCKKSLDTGTTTATESIDGESITVVESSDDESPSTIGSSDDAPTTPADESDDETPFELSRLDKLMMDAISGRNTVLAPWDLTASAGDATLPEALTLAEVPSPTGTTRNVTSKVTNSHPIISSQISTPAETNPLPKIRAAAGVSASAKANVARWITKSNKSLLSSKHGKHDDQLTKMISDWPMPSGVWEESYQKDEEWPTSWLHLGYTAVEIKPRTKDEIRNDELLGDIQNWPVATGLWACDDEGSLHWPADWSPEPSPSKVIASLPPISEENEECEAPVPPAETEKEEMKLKKTKNKAKGKNKKGKSKKTNKRR